MAGTSTCTVESYVMTETISSGERRLIAFRAACFAWAILSPLIEPDLSRTMARLTRVCSPRSSRLKPVIAMRTYATDLLFAKIYGEPIATSNAT